MMSENLQPNATPTELLGKVKSLGGRQNTILNDRTPPLDSKMTYTPADFCIGESGIWFFSLLWEHGHDAPPVEFLDDKNVLEER